MDQNVRPPRHLIQVLPLRYLLIVPMLLAIGTIVTLFVHSDTNVVMLYSQCHARSRIPWLSHVPVVGAPSCFLVSFFQEALAPVRGAASLGAVLAFVGGLLTVSLVEAARVCNAPSALIRYPTLPWIVFNLVGGAVVWELLIVPAFLRRARQVIVTRRTGRDVLSDATDPDFGEAMRHLSSVAEVVAIPTAVAVGYFLPSGLMLVLDHPIAIVVWLFFPVWVSLVRVTVRFIITTLSKEGIDTVHLESRRVAIVVVYALPVLASVAAHAFLIYSLVTTDDRKEMTRATTKFIEIDAALIGLTVLYWLLVEAGRKVALAMIVASVFLGPGAGACIAWVYREGKIDPDRSVTCVAVGSREGREASEETPLLG
ncbi:hypothetical protein GQ53DRAFT_533609 [Thozetella sp. PMI_491]|nr:hypothetical protein GQ53DRAFT_533609 [Thozetella sp. PMI_491]